MGQKHLIMAKMMKMKAAPMMAKMMAKKKKTIFGKKFQVFNGLKVKTNGGLKKSDLMKNSQGKIVSKKASQRARHSKGIKKILAWTSATKTARKALGIKGFVPIGGKTKQGQVLLAKVRSIYKK